MIAGSTCKWGRKKRVCGVADLTKTVIVVSPLFLNIYCWARSQDFSWGGGGVAEVEIQTCRGVRG